MLPEDWARVDTSNFTTSGDGVKYLNIRNHLIIVQFMSDQIRNIVRVTFMLFLTLFQPRRRQSLFPFLSVLFPPH